MVKNAFHQTCVDTYGLGEMAIPSPQQRSATYINFKNSRNARLSCGVKSTPN